MRREARLKLKNSLFFSLLAGNFAVETGSTTTASATERTLNFQAFLAELSNRPTMFRASTSQFKTSRSALTSRTLRLRSAWLHALGLDHRNRSGGGQVL